MLCFSWLHREVKRPCKQRLKAKHLDQNSVQMLGHNWMQSNRQSLNSNNGLNYCHSNIVNFDNVTRIMSDNSLFSIGGSHEGGANS